MHQLDPFGQDIARRCRWAIEHNHGHPSDAWSTGERLAAALVLRDRKHIADMGYTATEAALRVRGGMTDPPADFRARLRAVRTSTRPSD